MTEEISTARGTNISLDFKTIKQNLKSYLQNQEEFSDYNFDTSGMSIILDILAYNTQMNAMTAHLALNELFLDSAQVRPNIVSLVKQLGYLPGSVTGSTATINLRLRSLSITPTTDQYILEENQRFSGGGYTWYNTSSVTAELNDNNEFVFENLELKQGTRKEIRYFYDSRIQYQRFEIPDQDVDVSTIKVSVRESQGSDFSTTYKRFETFSDITNDDAVYFIQENPYGRYEIYFVNRGGVGLKPSSGNVVEISYFFCKGIESNGVSSFTADFVNTSEYVPIITTVNSANGGAQKELKESIRANAPKFYSSQNRCVTTSDYEALIKNTYPQIEAISVWGGETVNPPEYGKVYICAKPFNAEVLTDQEKTRILNDTLIPKSVVTVTPVLVDPDYTYLKLDVESQFDALSTTKTKPTLIQQIKDVFEMYNTQYLNTFDKVFRYSQLLSMIDNSDFAILNSAMRVTMYKEINYLNIASFSNEFNLDIPVTPFLFYRNNTGYIDTSPFFIGGVRHYLRDIPDESSTTRRQLRVVYFDSAGVEKTFVFDAGYIDLAERKIQIKGFRPDGATSLIKIFMRPSKFDIASINTQLLRIDLDESRVSITQDPVSQYGNAGANQYNSAEYRYL